jgi:hypothetical protein
MPLPKTLKARNRPCQNMCPCQGLQDLSAKLREVFFKAKVRNGLQPATILRLAELIEGIEPA